MGDGAKGAAFLSRGRSEESTTATLRANALTCGAVEGAVHVRGPSKGIAHGARGRENSTGEALAGDEHNPPVSG